MVEPLNRPVMSVSPARIFSPATEVFSGPTLASKRAWWCATVFFLCCSFGEDESGHGVVEVSWRSSSSHGGFFPIDEIFGGRSRRGSRVSPSIVRSCPACSEVRRWPLPRGAPSPTRDSRRWRGGRRRRRRVEEGGERAGPRERKRREGKRRREWAGARPTRGEKQAGLRARPREGEGE